MSARAAAATLVLVACSRPGTSTPEAAAPFASASPAPALASALPAAEPPGPPVTGKLFGRPFTGGAAYAKKTETAGEVQIWILDREASCGALVKRLDDARALEGLPVGTIFLRLTVPWKVGEPTQVSDYTAAAYVNGQPRLMGRGVRSGTLELVAAPTTAGAKGKLRVDVQSYTAGEGAKGEIDLTVCP